MKYECNLPTIQYCDQRDIVSHNFFDCNNTRSIRLTSEPGIFLSSLNKQPLFSADISRTEDLSQIIRLGLGIFMQQ